MPLSSYWSKQAEINLKLMPYAGPHPDTHTGPGPTLRQTQKNGSGHTEAPPNKGDRNTCIYWDISEPSQDFSAAGLISH